MKQISPHELHARLTMGEAILVDVREPEEHRDAHIEGSVLIPLGTLCESALPQHVKMIVCHCKSGGRSSRACHKLQTENPSLDVYNLEGGITAWKNAGLPVKSAER